MSAATITAIMSPRSPGGRREVCGPRACAANSGRPPCGGSHCPARSSQEVHLPRGRSQGWEPRGGTQSSGGRGAPPAPTEPSPSGVEVRGAGLRASFISPEPMPSHGPHIWFPSPRPLDQSPAKGLLAGCPTGTQFRGEGSLPIGRSSSTSLGYAMSEQPAGLLHTFWQISGSAQATWSVGERGPEQSRQTLRAWPKRSPGQASTRRQDYWVLSAQLSQMKRSLGVPVVAQWFTNPTRNHEVAGSIPAVALWVNDLALP